MKILIILLIFSLSLTTFFIADSYASEHRAPTSHHSIPEILLQIEVRNSDGFLVSYLEPSRIFLRNIGLIHDFLDEQEYKKIVSINGIIYQQIEWKHKGLITTTGDQQSGYGVGHLGYEILHARINGSISGEGDIVTAYWRITRTI